MTHCTIEALLRLRIPIDCLKLLLLVEGIRFLLDTTLSFIISFCYSPYKIHNVKNRDIVGYEVGKTKFRLPKTLSGFL